MSEYTDVAKLLSKPDSFTRVNLMFRQLADETGVKLARCLAGSTSIQQLSLGGNRFGEATYLAIAAALRVNTSLRELYVDGNRAVDQSRVDAAFVEALRLNPNRPPDSAWLLYAPAGSSSDDDYLPELIEGDRDFARLRAEAERLGPPSLLMQLLAGCE